MSSPHRLLRASAGTGKTYQLATHFAALLAAGVEPGRVLATTFTRKAAGEILDRVLGRFVEAARDDAKGERARDELTSTARALGAEIAPLERDACAARLAELARGLGSFQVRTLDAFFVQVARLFAYELGLAPEWHIVDEVEDEALRADVLARLIAELGEAERSALLQDVARSGAPSAAHKELLGAIDRGLSLHREALPGAWRTLGGMQAPEPEDYERAVRCLKNFEVPLKKDGQPRTNWNKFKDSVGALLERRDWKSWWGATLVKNALGGKAKFDYEEIPDDLLEAVNCVSHQATAEELAAVIAENHATGDLLELYIALEGEARDATGSYRFESFPRALSAGPASARDEERRAQWLSDLGFRLDGRVQHLLLDEFQDTSPLQWRLLLPLAEEILDTFEGGGERSFFCVGDTKQSIYGWREAEPRLLGELHEQHPVLVPEHLSTSWRSSQVVLDTVNLIFKGVAGRKMFAGEERAGCREAAERWESGFQKHTRAPEAGACPGAALLHEAQPQDGEKNAEACIALAAKRVQILHAEAPQASIAVLVRSKKNVPALLYRLRRLDIAASDEGGNPLTDAALVTQALALLHLADHPKDGVARLAVCASPFAAHCGLTLEDASGEAGAERTTRASAQLRRELLAEGYGGLLERLGQTSLAAASAWDRTRFAQLVELALIYDQRAGLRPAAFAQLVRRTPVEDPSASRVKVMTIHASKGLEFDAVILPELTGELIDSRADLYSHRAQPLAPIELLTRAPRKSVSLSVPELTELRAESQGRGLVDELSALYVATTRAVHRLEMIVPPPPDKGTNWDSARYHVLLRASLCADATPDDEGVLWRQEGNAETWHAPPREQPAPPESAPAAELALSVGEPRTRARHTPSGTERAPVDAAGLLTPSGRRGRALGTLVHALFEDLVWIEDEARSEAQLLERCRRQAPSEELAAQAVARFREALAHDEVRAALSRSSVPAGHEARVQNERAFDVELGTDELGELWGGSIDRLVLHLVDGRVVGAEVIDYKSNAVDAAGVQACAAGYAAQLDSYRRAVCAMYALAPEVVRASTLFVRPGVRHDYLLD